MVPISIFTSLMVAGIGTLNMADIYYYRELFEHCDIILILYVYTFALIFFFPRHKNEAKRSGNQCS